MGWWTVKTYALKTCCSVLEPLLPIVGGGEELVVVVVCNLAVQLKSTLGESRGNCSWSGEADVTYGLPPYGRSMIS